jgi:hypothetical protein
VEHATLEHSSAGFAPEYDSERGVLGKLRRARQRAQARTAASQASATSLDLASLEADLLADEVETT